MTGAEVAIRIVGLVNGKPSPFDGQWLVEYDPARPAGAPMTAHIVCSPDQSAARRFRDVAAAHAYWRMESGRPFPADRPLTAFNIIVSSA